MKEFNAKKEIESLSKAILLTAILCIFYTMLGYYFTDKRLDAHKEVIELMNEANKSQQESINLLMKNQILLNNKLKRYERNK